MTEFVTRSWDVFESDDRLIPKPRSVKGGAKSTKERVLSSRIETLRFENSLCEKFPLRCDST